MDIQLTEALLPYAFWSIDAPLAKTMRSTELFGTYQRYLIYDLTHNGLLWPWLRICDESCIVFEDK